MAARRYFHLPNWAPAFAGVDRMEGGELQVAAT